MTRLLPLACVVLALSATAAEKLPKADRIAAAPTPAQGALIREGITLHDQASYDAAISKYKQVLSENPWEVNALHELAFTYFVKKDYRQALATARLGAQCRSEALPRFYMMIGNALDELGKAKDAIDVYKAAVKEYPRLGLLHYNLAISLNRAGKKSEAKSAVEQAVRYDPNHASSHLTLAGLYRDMGYRVPAILAYSRFLLLEPESPRAVDALPILQQLMLGGVSSKGPNQINILISSTPKGLQDEGDFAPTEMMMSIIVASDLITKPADAQTPPLPPASPYDKLVSLYASMGESIENSKPKKGFAATYYAPYFAALAKAGHTQAFVAHAWKAGAVPGSSAWATGNGPKLEAFRSWSQSYQWPVD